MHDTWIDVIYKSQLTQTNCATFCDKHSVL